MNTKEKYNIKEVNCICPVCFEKFSPENGPVEEKCGHLFHASCVEGKTDCPICAEIKFDKLKQFLHDNKERMMNSVNDLYPRRPKKNVLGWMKDEYVEKGWKFFDPMIGNAEKLIETLLKTRKDEIKGENDYLRKKSEAALIWFHIREFEGVKDKMYRIYREKK